MVNFVNRFTVIGAVFLTALLLTGDPVLPKDSNCRKVAPQKSLPPNLVLIEELGRKYGKLSERVTGIAHVAVDWAEVDRKKAQKAIDRALEMTRLMNDYHAQALGLYMEEYRSEFMGCVDSETWSFISIPMGWSPFLSLIAAQKTIDREKALYLVDLAAERIKGSDDPHIRSEFLRSLTAVCVDLDHHKAEALADSIELAEFRARGYTDMGKYLAAEKYFGAEVYFNKAWEACTEISDHLCKVYRMSDLALAWYELNERSGRRLFEEVLRMARLIEEPGRRRALMTLGLDWAECDPEKAFEIDRLIQWPGFYERALYFMNQAWRSNEKERRLVFIMEAIQAFPQMPPEPGAEIDLTRIICDLCRIDPEKCLQCLPKENITSFWLKDRILSSAAISIFERDVDRALFLATQISIENVEERVGAYCRLAEKLLTFDRSKGLELLKAAGEQVDRAVGQGVGPEYPGICRKNKAIVGDLFVAWGLYSFSKATAILNKYPEIEIEPDRVIHLIEKLLDRGSRADAEAAHKPAVLKMMMLPPIPRAAALRKLAVIWSPVDPGRADEVFHLACQTLISQN